MKSINYGRQTITQDDIEIVKEALLSDYLTQGPFVEKFEKSFADYVQVDHAIAVTNATAALHLSCLALGLQKNQKVITTSNTFVASANCVRYCEGHVDFVDIDPNTFCIDLNQVEDLLKKSPAKTYAGVIPVDFAGYPIALNELKTLSEKYGFWIIEDACHAPGAEYQNSAGHWIKTGSAIDSDISVFSFHPVKHIATGEGGMMTTRNPQLAKKLRSLRSHGITRDSQQFRKNDGAWYYEMQELGYNFRMPDINSALGYSQMKRMPQNISRRREIAAKYDHELKNLPLKTPQAPENIRHAYHLYVIQTEKRAELYQFLKTKNIHCQIHYIPVHTQPYYVDLYGPKSLPHVEKYYSQCLSLPMYHGMTVDEQTYVIAAINEFYGR